MYLISIAFIECTEQQLQRHKNKKRKKMYYPIGKKKKHTIKNQLVNKPGFLIHKANHNDVGMIVY